MYSYSDSDWDGDQDDKKSTTGYFFMLGSAPFSRGSKKQVIVALFSCEIEYVATSYVAYRLLWLGMLLEEFKVANC